MNPEGDPNIIPNSSREIRAAIDVLEQCTSLNGAPYEVVCMEEAAPIISVLMQQLEKVRIRERQQTPLLRRWFDAIAGSLGIYPSPEARQKAMEEAIKFEKSHTLGVDQCSIVSDLGWKASYVSDIDRKYFAHGSSAEKNFTLMDGQEIDLSPFSWNNRATGIYLWGYNNSDGLSVPLLAVRINDFNYERWIVPGYHGVKSGSTPINDERCVILENQNADRKVFVSITRARTRKPIFEIRAKERERY